MNGWVILFTAALFGGVKCAWALHGAVINHRLESMLDRCRPGFLAAPAARGRRRVIAMWIAAVVVEVGVAVSAAWCAWGS